MSTTTTAHGAASTPVKPSGEHSHPSDWLYVKVAVILAVFTTIEVLTYFLDFGPAMLPTLIGLMIVKFVLVVLFFMHLRFDSKLFGRMFYAGLALALGVYLVVLTTFEFWNAGA